MFQGKVSVTYHDGSAMIGNIVEGNQLHGLVRHYDITKQLVAIKAVKTKPLALSVEENTFLWKRLDKNVRSTNIFRIKEKRNRVIIFTGQFEKDVYNCQCVSPLYWKLDFFHDCYLIRDIIYMEAQKCNPLINDKTRLNASMSRFSYNLRDDVTYMRDQPFFSWCNEENNTTNIRNSIETWWELMSVTDKDPFTYGYSESPLENMYINFENITYFKKRALFKKALYQIFSFDKLLHEGFMLNGNIRANVTIENLYDWIGLLKIVVYPDTNHGILKSKMKWTIYGSLHKSLLNGVVRIFGTLPNDPNDDCIDSTLSGLAFLCRYINGVPSGYCWKRLLGGSWIHGKIEQSLEPFTGKYVYYVNQDALTSLKGTFKNGVMINATYVEVIGEYCKEGIKILKFSDPPLLSTTYRFTRPNSSSMGYQPLVVDPLDNKYVKIGHSSIETREPSQDYKENGAFANRDIPSGTVICHNNGYIYHSYIVKSDKYSAKLNCGEIMDIPTDVGQNTTKYLSTRGHKINHSFNEMNAQNILYDSAQFGIVNGIKIREGLILHKNTEIFSHYGYKFSSSPQWYKELFLKFLSDGPSDNIPVNVKSCSFSHGSIAYPQSCEKYQHDIKMRLLNSLKISSIENMSSHALDDILKRHFDLSLKPIKSGEIPDDTLSMNVNIL